MARAHKAEIGKDEIRKILGDKDNKILRLEKDLERMKKSLRNENYGLAWIDVPEAFEDDVENKLPIVTAVPKLDIKNNDGKPTHLLIEAENYHALTCLNYTHKGKVDVIYIDPPYNTGTDGFRYKDKRVLDKYPDGTEVPTDHPLRHSYWLSFMRKRIELAKDLLTDQGFLAVSIDDNEYSQLKILLDNVFQENVKTVVVKMSEASGLKMSSIKKSGSIPKYKEYLLIAKPSGVKNLFFDQIPKEEWDREYNIYVNNLTKEDRAVIDALSEKEGLTEADLIESDAVLSKITLHSLSSEIKSIGLRGAKEIKSWCFENAWRICRTAAGDSVKVLADKKRKVLKQQVFSVISKRDGILYIVKSDYPADVRRPRVQILFADTYLSTHPGDLWTDIKTTGLEAEGGVSFKNGKKPLQLLKRIINAATNKKAIVLDFFAGSGTTAQAVLELNAKDKGARQFIMVTNNEGNIMSEICYPRVVNVIHGKNNQPKLGGSAKYYRIGFVGENSILNASDKDKLALTHNASELLAIAENTLEGVVKNSHFEIFENEDRNTAVYFKESFDKFDDFTKKVLSLKKPTTVYIFSWENDPFVDEFEDNPSITVKTIPEPILEIYRRIHNL